MLVTELTPLRHIQKMLVTEWSHLISHNIVFLIKQHLVALPDTDFAFSCDFLLTDMLVAFRQTLQVISESLRPICQPLIGNAQLMTPMTLTSKMGYCTLAILHHQMWRKDRCLGWLSRFLMAHRHHLSYLVPLRYLVKSSRWNAYRTVVNNAGA